MKGLIYKDITILLKGIKPVVYLFVAVAFFLFFYLGGELGGFFSTISLSLTGGIFCTMSIQHDEKVSWPKYQCALPVSSIKSVSGKYLLSLIITLSCVVASVIFFFVNGFVHSNYDWTLLFLQMAIAVLLPILWSSTMLPLSLWLGYQVSSFAGMILCVPLVFIMKYFEENSVVYPEQSVLIQYFIIGLIFVTIFACISYFISIAIHKYKEFV